MNPIRDHETTIAQMAELDEELAPLRQQVKEIVEGTAFRGSERCGRFLTYVVDQAIAGRPESLKERVIGVEVFGRSPDYNTSEDAIVRVTASDVRKRLQQHYRKSGAVSGIQIKLPVGSYIPEIARDPQPAFGGFAIRKARQNQPAASSNSKAPSENSNHALIVAHNPASVADPVPDPRVAAHPALPPEAALSGSHSSSGLRLIAVVLSALVILLAALNLDLWNVRRKDAARARSAAVSVVPWSAFFSSQHPTHLITSDPDIARIQKLTGSRISISDYASRNYVPAHLTLTPEVKQIILTMLRGDDVPLSDTRIAVDVGEFAKESARRIDVQNARNLRLPALKTDDNFIFLGSPYSDPWFSLFTDQLDFRIIREQDFVEIIRNVHPAPGEQTLYIPTVRGSATGESFAIVALVENPDQYGQVLLVAGLSAEGTHAAGKLITDLPRLSEALRKCGIQPSGPLKHFEMLLRVNTMAGYSSDFNVVACHILP